MYPHHVNEIIRQCGEIGGYRIASELRLHGCTAKEAEAALKRFYYVVVTKLFTATVYQLFVSNAPVINMRERVRMEKDLNSLSCVVWWPVPIVTPKQVYDSCSQMEQGLRREFLLDQDITDNVLDRLHQDLKPLARQQARTFFIEHIRGRRIIISCDFPLE